MLNKMLIKLLGGINKYQVQELHNHYQSLLKEKENRIKYLTTESKIYNMTPLLRGKRHDTIILPESKEVFIEWIHRELLPTLDKKGYIINRIFTENIKG